MISNDVDRALILRAFERNKFTLPSKLVDDAVHESVTKEAGGDSDEFARQLRAQGCSVADFRRFTSEEIKLQAMVYHQGQDVWYSARARESWLRNLRAYTIVKKLASQTNADG